MHHLKRRIAALESRDRIATRFVWRNSGETPDKAISKIERVLEDDVTVIGWRDQAEIGHGKERTLFPHFYTRGRG